MTLFYLNFNKFYLRYFLPKNTKRVYNFLLGLEDLIKIILFSVELNCKDISKRDKIKQLITK